MAQENFGVVFGPGGEILPENEKLLEQIKQTPELPPAALLKLGAYYREYSTNRSLGDHLVLIALLKLVNDQDAMGINQEVLVTTAANKGMSIGTKEDKWDKEDYLDLACDDPDEKGCWPFIRAFSLPQTNLELLIETPSPYDERYFVIGIAPTGPIPTVPKPEAS